MVSLSINFVHGIHNTLPIFKHTMNKTTIGGVIKLADNSEISDAGQRRLQEALRKNSTLQQLSVHTNKISDGAIDAICSFVRHNQTMSNFKLSSRLSDAALSRLLQCLCFNKKLKVMKLYGILESTELIDAICDFVHHNNTMTHLDCRMKDPDPFSQMRYGFFSAMRMNLNLETEKLVLLLTALRDSPMLTLRLTTIGFGGQHLGLLMDTLGVSSPVTSIETIKKGPEPCLKVMRSGVQQPSYYFYLGDGNDSLELLEQEDYKTAKQAQIERQRRNKPLSNALKAVLDRNRDNLVDNMTPDRVYDHLRKDNSLTLREVEDVTFNKPRYQQVQMLLDFLHRKSRQDYENFKKALIETQQDYLEEVLTAAERKAGIYEKPIQEHLQDLLSTAEGDAGIH